MDPTYLTKKDQLRRSGQAQPGSPPHLPWCGRPCCRPWQDAPPDVRPIGQPAAAFHLPSAALHHILRRLDTVCSNSPGTLTLLPDNPPTSIPPRRLESVFTSRSSQPSDPSTIISDRKPQACERRMQYRRLHSRTPFNGCAPADGMQTTVFSLGGLYFC